MDVSAALRHLRKTGAPMEPLLRQHRRPHYRPARSSFETLSRAIVGQQLSGKAADTIYGRLLERLPERRPRPRDILALSTTELRSAGLSGSKSEFLQCLARAYVDGTVKPRSFARMDDDELRAHLTQVKGLGVWTVDMFLIFGLLRADVLPTGDLGIRKGMQRAFSLPDLPRPGQMIELAESWRPYRSVACHYMWRLVDG